MTRPEDIAALESDLPWDRPSFRADLAVLSSSTAAAARQLAADARVLARLAAQVPRCPMDETGATPWTSFRREVAVARQVSDQAAGIEIRQAQRLTSVLLSTLALLDHGAITSYRARVFAQELDGLPDALAHRIDADLADRAATVAPWRIKDAVRRAALVLDPDVAVARHATATAARNVRLTPHPDGQACVVVSGPAVPLTRWHATLDRRARALRAAGDPRTLDALRFDLTTSTRPCATHPPATPAGPATPSAQAPAPARSSTTEPGSTDAEDTPTQPSGAAATVSSDTAPAGLRLSGVEAPSGDCRISRPVQAHIVVPVETALGLSNEPGWLDGYGWLDAPTSRTLLLDAELRRICAATGTGQILDLDQREQRPPPTPDGLRQALLTLLDPHGDGTLPLSQVATRSEAQHEPSPSLRQLITLRDRNCDGPTQSQTSANRCDLDHDQPWPNGPTAAWNLIARSRRTHQLKHAGWTPLRTATSTLWNSPAGQLVHVPLPHQPHPESTPTPTAPPPTCPTRSSSPTSTPSNSPQPPTSHPDCPPPNNPRPPPGPGSKAQPMCPSDHEMRTAECGRQPTVAPNSEPST